MSLTIPGFASVQNDSHCCVTPFCLHLALSIGPVSGVRPSTCAGSVSSDSVLSPLSLCFSRQAACPGHWVWYKLLWCLNESFQLQFPWADLRASASKDNMWLARPTFLSLSFFFEFRSGSLIGIRERKKQKGKQLSSLVKERGLPRGKGPDPAHPSMPGYLS